MPVNPLDAFREELARAVEQYGAPSVNTALSLMDINHDNIITYAETRNNDAFYALGCEPRGGSCQTYEDMDDPDRPIASQAVQDGRNILRTVYSRTIGDFERNVRYYPDPGLIRNGIRAMIDRMDDSSIAAANADLEQHGIRYRIPANFIQEAVREIETTHDAVATVPRTPPERSR